MSTSIPRILTLTFAAALSAHALAQPAAGKADKVFLKATSKQVAELYQKSTFGFRKTHDGKTLEVTGPMRKLFEEKDNGKTTAGILITGVPQSQANFIELRDEIECTITDAKILAAAAKLKPGQVVTVRGVYDSRPKLNTEIRVALDDCQIL